MEETFLNLKWISLPVPRLASQLLSENKVALNHRAHFVGATGSGMKALAEVLLDDGWILTGSDSSPEAGSLRILEQRGMTISRKHDSELVSDSVDLVIYSAAIPETNVERQRAKELAIPQFSYVDAVARLMRRCRGIAVAGTHGKSSTTALIASVFENSGIDATFLCGAQRLQDERNGKLGSKIPDGEEVIIVEACEYRSHFLALRPEVICLLGIEADHFDCFPDLNSTIAAYRQFVSNLSNEGRLVYNFDCKISAELAQQLNVQTVSFSATSEDADWFSSSKSGKVTVFRQGVPQQTFDFGLPGKHNLMNLTAAFATADQFRVDTANSEIVRGLDATCQLKRRFELVESSESRTVINDYAHHPTEVRATILAARQRFPGSRLVCCFQPHQLSRTQNLRDEFIEALSLADRVYLLPVFAAREQSNDELCHESQRLVEQLQSQDVSATFVPALDRVWRTLETDTQENDVILTLGAGDITCIHNERTR